MPQFFLLVIFISLFFFVICSLIIYFLVKKYQAQKLLSQSYDEIIPSNSTYEFIDNIKVEEYRGMLVATSKFKKILTALNLKSVYLVHGTFVGEDPWHFFEFLSSGSFNQTDNFLLKLKAATKQGQDILAQDRGNFTAKHVRILNKVFGDAIIVQNFSWSSGNHHYARIKALIDLIKNLVITHSEGDRILLMGHSHGAQVFALLTQFICSSKFYSIILKYFSSQIDEHELKLAHKKLRTFRFDFITFGAPVRYSWKLNSKINLVHFINHRGDDTRGGTNSGVLQTRDGDYIQQWGIAGSDFSSPIDRERKINKELDEYLGVGINRNLLKEQVKYRKRLHNCGHHYLVDYGDNAKLPNFMKSVFGHGVYTKIDLLRFHFIYILDYLDKQRG